MTTPNLLELDGIAGGHEGIGWCVGDDDVPVSPVVANLIDLGAVAGGHEGLGWAVGGDFEEPLPRQPSR